MKASPPKSFLLRAKGHTSQIIRCSVKDQLVQILMVKVVLFFERSVAASPLWDALSQVLSHYPTFAGSLKKVDGTLYIDCNNQGLKASVVQRDVPLEQILQRLFIDEEDKLIENLNPKKMLTKGSPISSIRISYFADGTMCMGLCWNHSVGDMHTLLCLLNAWSKTIHKEAFEPPMLLEDTDDYLKKQLKKSYAEHDSLHYATVRELLSIALYLLLKARKKKVLRFYFSQDELVEMKRVFAEKSNKKLSTNDVLSAHFLSHVAKADPKKRHRYLGIVANYRSRLGLPAMLLGNHISSINLLCESEQDTIKLAERLRIALENFAEEHADFWNIERLVASLGSRKKLSRCVAAGIDPTSGNLVITNWSNFGVYDLEFGAGNPIYFSNLGSFILPWISDFVEGPEQQGIMATICLPEDIAHRMLQKESLASLHQYKISSDTHPLIEQLHNIF